MNKKYTINLKGLLEKIQKESKGLEELIEMFRPLIKSYSNKCFRITEREDMESLLIIRLIEVAKIMTISERDGENVNYITTAIRFQFLNSIKKFNQIAVKEDFASEETFTELIENDSDTDLIFEDLISSLDEVKQQIIRLKFKKMLSDAEIATILGKSRQAIHKQLRKSYQQLLITSYP